MMRENPEAAIWVGRVFGLIVIVIVIAVGLKFATDFNQQGGFDGWVFFQIIVTPMGIGFLILVATEAINQLRPR